MEPSQPLIGVELAGSRPNEDAALVAGVLRKDRKATAEFVARYSDLVFRYVRSRLDSQTGQIDDTVQEIFLAAWRDLQNYRGESSLQAWILGIARHKVEDHYRSIIRQAESLDGVDEEELPAVPGTGLEASIDRARLAEKTRRILNSVPANYRAALLWRYWEQCSARDMAARTGRTEKAIERLLARARHQFQKRWNDE